MHWFKKNIGDYHKKAGRLSMLEHGAYTLLMDSCYDRERFPTDDEAYDWCWARTDEEKAAVRFVLGKFFTLIDGKYVQLRIQEEIEAYHEKAAKNAEIAKKREENRTKRKRNVHEPLPDEHEAPPNQEPVTSNQEPRTSSNSLSGAIVRRRDSFEWTSQMAWLDEHCPSLTFDDQILEHQKWVNQDPGTDRDLAQSYRRWMLQAEQYFSQNRRRA